MKDRIKEYLKEKGRVTVNDLAQALGKDGSKDFRELIKTLSLMERKHQIALKKMVVSPWTKRRNTRLLLKELFMPTKMALVL